jgi:hypothetical protein
MKNLLAFLGAAVLVFVGVGLYLNWFHIARGPAVAGHKAFNIDLNTDKIKSDAEKGGEKVVDAIEKARREAEDKAKAEAEKKAEADRAADGEKTPESVKVEK